MDEEKLLRTLKRMRDFKSHYREDYLAGLVAEQDLRRGLSELDTMFDDGLAELDLRRKRPFTNENMGRYADDYGLWADGNEPNSSTGEPWLMRWTEDGGSCVEASPEERAGYFLLAREAFIEIRTDEFPPDEIERPTRYETVYGDGSNVTVLFDCVDDDGLVCCNDARGKTFNLTAANGLRATIEVDARAGYDYKPAWEKNCQFRGLVSVEGYTVQGLHSTGCVEVFDGRVGKVSYNNMTWIRGDHRHVDAICTPEEHAAARSGGTPEDAYITIATKQGERNEEVYRNFPRWQPYFEWVRAHPTKLLSPSEVEYIDEFLSDALRERGA